MESLDYEVEESANFSDLTQNQISRDFQGSSQGGEFKDEFDDLSNVLDMSMEMENKAGLLTLGINENVGFDQASFEENPLNAWSYFETRTAFTNGGSTWATDGQRSVYLRNPGRNQIRPSDYCQFSQKVNLTEIKTIIFDMRGWSWGTAGHFRYQVYVGDDILFSKNQGDSDSFVDLDNSIDVSGYTGIQDVHFRLKAEANVRNSATVYYYIDNIRPVKGQTPYGSGTAVTENMTLPEGCYWDKAFFGFLLKENAEIKISFISTDTGEMIGSLIDLNSSPIDLTALNVLSIASIRMKMDFISDVNSIPKLDHWLVSYLNGSVLRDNLVDGRFMKMDSNITYGVGNVGTPLRYQVLNEDFDSPGSWIDVQDRFDLVKYSGGTLELLEDGNAQAEYYRYIGSGHEEFFGSARLMFLDQRSEFHWALADGSFADANRTFSVSIRFHGGTEGSAELVIYDHERGETVFGPILLLSSTSLLAWYDLDLYLSNDRLKVWINDMMLYDSLENNDKLPFDDRINISLINATSLGDYFFGASHVKFDHLRLGNQFQYVVDFETGPLPIPDGNLRLNYLKIIPKDDEVQGINYSLIDFNTGLPIPGYTGLMPGVHSYLGNVPRHEYPDLALRIFFLGPGNISASLDAWVLYFEEDVPKAVKVIPDLEIMEDMPGVDLFNISEVFFDSNSPFTDLSFEINNLTGLPIQGNVSDNSLEFRSTLDNWTGISSFTVTGFDGDGSWAVSAPFNVTVLPVNDAPVWTGDLESLQVLEDGDKGFGNINLLKYIEDAENDPVEFDFIEQTRGNILPYIHNSSWLGITTTEDFYGNGTIHIQVREQGNSSMAANTSISIQVLPVNDAPVSYLQWPVNDMAVDTDWANFTWQARDVDSDVEQISYVFELKDKSSGQIFEFDTRDLYYNFSGLQGGHSYIWTVIPNDGLIDGQCGNGTWNLSVTEDANVPIPPVNLVSPDNGTYLEEDVVELKWNIFLEDINSSNPILSEIQCQVYISTKLEDILVRDSNSMHLVSGDDRHLLVQDLDKGSTYYWTVLPVFRGREGACTQGYYSFTVNATAKTPPLLISVSPGKLILERGNSSEIELSVESISSDVIRVDIEISGSVAKYLKPMELPSISLSPGSRSTNYLTFSPPEYVKVGNYTLEFKASVSSENFTGTVSCLTIITGREGTDSAEDGIDPEDDVAGDEGDGGTGDGSSEDTMVKDKESKFFTNYWWLVLVVILLLIVIILVLLFRKKTDEGEEEEEPDYDAEYDEDFDLDGVEIEYSPKMGRRTMDFREVIQKQYSPYKSGIMELSTPYVRYKSNLPAPDLDLVLPMPASTDRKPLPALPPSTVSISDEMDYIPPGSEEDETDSLKVVSKSKDSSPSSDDKYEPGGKEISTKGESIAMDDESIFIESLVDEPEETLEDMLDEDIFDDVQEKLEDEMDDFQETLLNEDVDVQENDFEIDLDEIIPSRKQARKNKLKKKARKNRTASKPPRKKKPRRKGRVRTSND